MLDFSSAYWMHTELPHLKYWIQRYRLFTNWSEGIRLDFESWFSVTPQIVAFHQAKRCIFHNIRMHKLPLLIIDAFTGSGSNSIEFSSIGAHVISCEINLSRMKMVSFSFLKFGLLSQLKF